MSGAGRCASPPTCPDGTAQAVLDALRAQLGPSLAVENDINLAALGEQAHGLGKGIANFVFVSVGTGIGMGIVIDGQLHRGARGAAGEIGFLPLGEAEVANEETSKRRRGSLESVASADAVVANARRLGMRGVLTAKQVFEATRDSDKVAMTAVRVEAEHLARRGGGGHVGARSRAGRARGRHRSQRRSPHRADAAAAPQAIAHAAPPAHGLRPR